MSGAGFMFLFSALMAAGLLCLAVWLLVSGQARFIDGLMMFLVSLLMASSFGLYLRYVIRSTLRALRMERSAGQDSRFGEIIRMGPSSQASSAVPIKGRMPATTNTGVKEWKRSATKPVA